MKPKIFCFSNVVNGGEGMAYAIAEDGAVLGSHFCSNEMYVSHDLGVTYGSRPDRHAYYAKHYPQGYEMEFVKARSVKSHKGLNRALNRAFILNEKQHREKT